MVSKTLEKIIVECDDNGIFHHVNCKVSEDKPKMQKSGSNPSGTKDCQRYVCTGCKRKWTNVKELYVPKDFKGE